MVLIFLRFIFNDIYVCMSMGKYVHTSTGGPGGQGKMLDVLELEL